MTRNQFGSVRKLPSGRFQARYIDAAGARITARTIYDKALTFATEKQARIYLIHLQSDLERGINPYAVIGCRRWAQGLSCRP